MFSVWTAVKVKTETAERFNEAGTVHATNPATHPDEVVVKFDKDGEQIAMAIADLQAL